MIVLADANLLVKLVDFKQDYTTVYQFFETKKATLALPTPVIAEFLVKDDNFDRSLFLSKINNFCQVFDFDFKSAQMSARVFRDLLQVGHFLDKNREGRQTVKVDIQLIGIALANQIPEIFTGDKEIMEIVEKLSLPIKVVNLEQENPHFDLPLFSEIN